MLEEKKVLDYLQRTGQRKVTIRYEGRLYLAQLHTDQGNQYSEPYDFVRIEELPPVIELVF